MVTATSEAAPYLTSFSNGAYTGHADTTPDKGGGGQGFRPHELLEAALASCMNMHLRMYADNNGLSPGRVTTAVSTNRQDPLKAVFRYSIAFSEPLSPEQTAKLYQIAATYPVHNTLLRQIVIQQETEPI